MVAGRDAGDLGNPTGAAMFAAPTPAALTVRAFQLTSAATEVARLAPTLRADGAVRLERLRGFGAVIGRPLTCACSRLTLDDGTAAVLIAAVEHAGPALSINERVLALARRRHRADRRVRQRRHAHRRHAGSARRIGGVTSLDALGAGTLAALASEHGQADGDAASRDNLDRSHSRSSGVGCRLRREAGAAHTRQRLNRRIKRSPCAYRSNATPTLDTSAGPDAPPIAEQPELFPDLPPTLPRLPRRQRTNAAIRCASSGRWTPRPLHHRLRRVHRADGTAHRRAARQPWACIAVGDRRSIPRARSRARSPPRDTWSGVIVRWPRRRQRRAARGRIVGPAGVRSRTDLSRLSRLRRLPRCRAQRSNAHRAARADASAEPPRDATAMRRQKMSCRCRAAEPTRRA